MGKMEKKLREAMIRGDMDSLPGLLSEYEISDIGTSKIFKNTPLHVAILLENLEFTKEILKQKPQLARILDSDGFSPLHIASSKGFTAIVSEILKIDSDLCLIRDGKGRLPIHLAAIRGRTEAFEKLYFAKPESIKDLTNLGETVFHLCLQNNQLAILKLAIELIDDTDFINLKDEKGNNVLHIAAARKQNKAMEFLLTHTGANMNERNHEGLTPMNLLVGSHCKSLDKSAEQEKIRPRSKKARFFHYLKTSNKWLEDEHESTLMIVAVVLAAMTFSAGLTPPGGTWQADGNGHRAGFSIAADRDIDDEYKNFMISNTISFLSSLSIMLLSLSKLPINRIVLISIRVVLLWVASISASFAYVGALRVISWDNSSEIGYIFSLLAQFIWLALMGLVFLGQIFLFGGWLIGKFGRVNETSRDEPRCDHPVEV